MTLDADTVRTIALSREELDDLEDAIQVLHDLANRGETLYPVWQLRGLAVRLGRLVDRWTDAQ